MRILTLGDSWTHGPSNNDPPDISWPCQMASRYNVEVVNLAQSGGSNARAARIGIEELTRDCNYDYVVFPLAPASRTEILKQGKWHQVWPNASWAKDYSDKIFTEYWHSFNDVQNTIMLCFYFCHSFVFEPRNFQDRLCHTNYGSAFTSVVSLNNVEGVQFHPEKSQKNGLRLLSNFMTWDVTAN